MVNVAVTHINSLNPTATLGGICVCENKGTVKRVAQVHTSSASSSRLLPQTPFAPFSLCGAEAGTQGLVHNGRDNQPLSSILSPRNHGLVFLVFSLFFP